MPRFQVPKWTKAMSVGNAEIDSQHKSFLDKVSQVASLIQEGIPPDIKIAAANMLELLKIHFMTEERIFGSTPYPLATSHSVEHQVLLHIAFHLKKMIDGSEDTPYLRLSLRYLAQSVIDHLMETDMGYKPYLSKADE